MKSELLILIFLTLQFGCASKAPPKLPEGKVVSVLSDHTFHAEIIGLHLKVGDRVTILKYKDFQTDLKGHQSRTLPFKKTKIKVGEGIISSVLENNFYELQLENPQHIPEGSFVEKL